MEGECMEKQILLSTISTKLNQMGISYSTGKCTKEKRQQGWNFRLHRLYTPGYSHVVAACVGEGNLGRMGSVGHRICSGLLYPAEACQKGMSAEYSMDSGDKGANVYVFSNLTNDKPWPEGEYKVEMYIEDRKAADATVDFVCE